MLSGDEESFKKAASVLLGIGDLAQTPMLEANTKNQDDSTWIMERVVDIQLEVRTKVVNKLITMLDDKRPLTHPVFFPAYIEEKPPHLRVCDSAYISLRRLLSTAETEHNLFLNTDRFSRNTEKEKDTEIARFKKARTWSNLLK